MYHKGKGVDQNDKEAVKWLRKAAEQENAFSQKSLGILYLKGKGVEQSDKEAVKWFRKAAEQGDAVSQNSLGTLYLKGKGVEQSDKEAVKWLRKAAEHCKTKEATHERVIIDLSEITTKKDPKSKGKQWFFPSQLYCDHPKLSKKCTDKSIWLSYNQLIKSRLGKKKVLCSFRNLSIKNGSKDDKIIIYLHKKKAI
jgi:hypothetical protein